MLHTLRSNSTVSPVAGMSLIQCVVTSARYVATNDKGKQTLTADGVPGKMQNGDSAVNGYLYSYLHLAE